MTPCRIYTPIGNCYLFQWSVISIAACDRDPRGYWPSFEIDALSCREPSNNFTDFSVTSKSG